MALYNSNKEATSDALDYWYNSEEKRIENLSEKFPISISDREKLNIEKMYEWCKTEKISHTPTLFIDGYKLPKEYEINDLLFLLS